MLCIDSKNFSMKVIPVDSDYPACVGNLSCIKFPISIVFLLVRLCFYCELQDAIA